MMATRTFLFWRWRGLLVAAMGSFPRTLPKGTVRRRFEANVEHLRTLLADDSIDVLATLWNNSRHEGSAALINEFMALGTHRPTVREVLAEATQRVRDLEIAALQRRLPADSPLTAAGILFLVSGVPKLMQLEEAFGVTDGHADVSRWFTALLQQLDERS